MAVGPGHSTSWARRGVVGSVSCAAPPRQRCIPPVWYLYRPWTPASLPQLILKKPATLLCGCCWQEEVLTDVASIQLAVCESWPEVHAITDTHVPRAGAGGVTVRDFTVESLEVYLSYKALETCFARPMLPACGGMRSRATADLAANRSFNVNPLPIL